MRIRYKTVFLETNGLKLRIVLTGTITRVHARYSIIRCTQDHRTCIASAPRLKATCQHRLPLPSDLVKIIHLTYFATIHQSSPAVLLFHVHLYTRTCSISIQSQSSRSLASLNVQLQCRVAAVPYRLSTLPLKKLRVKEESGRSTCINLFNHSASDTM